MSCPVPPPMVAGDRRRPFDPPIAAIVILSFLTLLPPFLCVDVPPLTDYPNHLARYWLIGGGALDPALVHFYRIDWSSAVTNVGADRFVALATPLVSALVAGHIALVASAVLPPLGLLALNTALGRGLSSWQAIFPMAAWSTTFLMGFVNFQTGLGLALLFAAADPLAQPRLWRGAVLLRVPFGLVLMVDHPFALFFYAVLIAGLAMGAEPLFPVRWAGAGPRLRRVASAAAWCVIPLAIITAWGRHALPGAQPPTHDLANPISYSPISGKLATLFSPLASYGVAQELVVVGLLTALFVWLCHRRALVVHGGLMFAGVGLVVVSILSPSRAAGATWVDLRFPIMALFCVLVSLRPRADLTRSFSLTWGAAALALASLQSAWVGWTWLSTRGDLQAIEAVLARIPAGAAVLPLQHDPTPASKSRAPAGRYIFGIGDPTYAHLDSLAVPLRRAFVPDLFAARGLQPLRVVGAWDGVVEHNGGDLASVSTLDRPPVTGEPSYIPGWHDRFDFVLVLDADMPDQSGAFHPPPGLSLVSDQGFAQLWRVTRAPRALGPAGSSH